MKFRLLLMALLVSFTANAQQKRVALLIGNNEYDGRFQRLSTSINDVEAMKNVLEKMGFDTVIVGKNVKRESMSAYMDSFSKLANGADLALFYYSGHAGIDNKDMLYLAPSGTYYNQATLVEDCYSFETVVRKVKMIGAPIKLFVIDACRNSLDDTKGEIKDFSPDAFKRNISTAKGMVYWFSSSIGQSSHTGNGKYSVFTSSVLNNIGGFDNLKIVWDRISDEVSRSRYGQSPNWRETEDGLSEKIFLNPDTIIVSPLVPEGKDYYSITTIPANANIQVGKNSYKSGEQFILQYGIEYEVKISADGYSAYHKKITATPYVTQYEITLDTLAKAEVLIQCNAKSATVYFDGVNVGFTPVKVNTYAGKHDIRIESSGYHKYYSSPILKAGSQEFPAKLLKDYPWFFEWDESPQNHISYLYSPKYQIGLQYLHRFEDSRFLVGVNIASSTGVFKGIDWSTQDTINIIIPGNDIDIFFTDSGTFTKTTYSLSSDDNHDFFDPNNEAKKYNSIFLFLISGGYQPCNGILLEAGFGVASHKIKYYMPYTYYLTKTVITNQTTGEIVGEPEYSYKRNDESQWYTGETSYSAAMRLGLKFIIPIESEFSLTLGGGYTHLFSNSEISSMDFSIGFSWSL